MRYGTSAVTAPAVAAAQRPPAAAAPLRPSSVQQPRSGAGLPLGEGLEGTEQQTEGSAMPAAALVHISATGNAQVAPSAAAAAILPANVAGAKESPKPTQIAISAEPAAANGTNPSTAASTLSRASADAALPSSDFKHKAIGSDLTKPPPHDSHPVTDDNTHSHSGSRRSCCSCSWLRTNVQSMGRKLDPWVILLSLVVSLAALAAGAVQMATRARTPDQKSAIQQVGC